MELEGREWWDFLSLVLCPECRCTPPSPTVRSSRVGEYPIARLSANPERFPQLWEQRFAGESATDTEVVTVCHLTRSSPSTGFSLVQILRTDTLSAIILSLTVGLHSKSRQDWYVNSEVPFGKYKKVSHVTFDITRRKILSRKLLTWNKIWNEIFHS